MNILVVDDKHDILSLVKTILEFDDHLVTTADNGDTAISLCKKTVFPLIFLDLMMDGRDGFSTHDEIRKTSLNKDSYIIALTAKAYENDQQLVLSRGFNDHFPKPFRVEALLTLVNDFIKKAP